MCKIRVLHFGLDRIRGGIESFLLNLYSQIDRDKFHFEFVTTSSTPALGDEFQRLGGIIHQVRPYYNLIGYMQDIKKLLQDRYDVVHFHKNSAVNILPILSCKYIGVKNIIVHSHNTSPSIGKMITGLHYFNRVYLNENVSNRLACSNEAGKWMFGYKEFHVLPNGIITKNFSFDPWKRKKKRAELKISEQDLVIGHVGRFTRQKNHDFLIDIFVEVCKRKKNSKLLLIGEGNLKEKIRRKVENYNLIDKVIFLGDKDDVCDWLNVMDVFLFPSLFEGLGIVLVEAQANGLHCIVSNNISKEVDFDSLISYVSLESSKETWAKIVLSAPIDRVDIQSSIEKHGYEMKNNVSFMEALYCRIGRK